MRVNRINRKKKRKNFKNIVFSKINFTQPNKFLLGVDIGTKNIKLVVSKKDSGHIKILFFKILPLSEEEYSPNKETILAIKDIIRTYPKSAQNVYFNVSGRDVFINKISFPPMEEKEILNAIKWEIEDQVSFPVKDANIKYKIIQSNLKQEGSKKTEVLVVAMSRKLSQYIIDVVKSTGIYIKAVYVTPCSLETIVQEFIDDNIVGILDLGFKNTTLSIYHKEGLRMIRAIPVTCYSLTNAMIGAFKFKDSRMELNFNQSERIKTTVGIPEPDEEGDIEGIPYSQIRAMLRPQQERLSTEIKQSFDYFQTRYKSSHSNVKKLFLCGGGARLKNLIKTLNDYLPFKVEKLPLPKLVSLDRSKLLDYLQLAPAIGAFLSIDELNLLPNQLKMDKVKRITMACMRIGIIIISILFLWSFINLSFKARDYSERLKYFNQPIQGVGKVNLMYQYIQNVENIANQITRDDIPGYLILKGLSSVVPETIFIQDLKLDNIKRVLYLKGGIIAPGQNFEPKLIDFKSKLEKLPFFSKVDLKKIYRMESETNKVNFEIECKFIEL